MVMPPNSHTSNSNAVRQDSCTGAMVSKHYSRTDTQNEEYGSPMNIGPKENEKISPKNNMQVSMPYNNTSKDANSTTNTRGEDNSVAFSMGVNLADYRHKDNNNNNIVGTNTRGISDGDLGPSLSSSSSIASESKKSSSTGRSFISKKTGLVTSTDEVLRKANEILQKSKYNSRNRRNSNGADRPGNQSIGAVGSTSPTRNGVSGHSSGVIQTSKNGSGNSIATKSVHSVANTTLSTPLPSQLPSVINPQDLDDVSVFTDSPTEAEFQNDNSPTFQDIPGKLCQAQNISREEVLCQLDGLDISSVRKETTPDFPQLLETPETKKSGDRNRNKNRKSKAKESASFSHQISSSMSMTLVNEDESVEAWSLFPVVPEKASSKSHKRKGSNSQAPVESIHSTAPSSQAEMGPSLPFSNDDHSSLEYIGSHSYEETNNYECPDSSMPTWIQQITNNKASAHKALDKYNPEVADCLSFDYDDEGEDGGVYIQGKSRSLVVHEIRRGNWTWRTEWSPDGNRLAMATENHHLAIVDCSFSSVWKVVYDKRIPGPMKKNTTHSVRSISWGAEFIAIGGTGDAVSIINPDLDNYPIVEVIRGTGFVGTLAWRADTSILAIGNREDQVMIVDVTSEVDESRKAIAIGGKKVKSKVLLTMERSDWVNSVSFSPGGSIVAVGDRSGKLSVYVYIALESSPSLSPVTDFEFVGAILDVAWSPCGSWLYAGGEDYSVNIIDANRWKIVHKIQRHRWVTFVSPSHSGTHVAIGGGQSEVSILDVQNGWEVVKNFDYGGIIPLSAAWHPKDHFLTITGQDNSISTVETTGLRYVKGRFLRSRSCVLAIDFAPDGSMICVGNEDGIVSFFDISSSDEFVLVHETVIGIGGYMHIRWSPNGRLVAVASGQTLVLINAMYDSKSMGPRSKSRFTVRRVLHGLETAVESISFVHDGNYLAISGKTTHILDVRDKLNCVVELKFGVIYSMDCSLDGSLIAFVGVEKHLSIVDTSHPSVHKWRVIFALKCETVGKAVAWGPMGLGGLRYLAYGGENSKVTIIEIRTQEETWEKVLTVPRGGKINGLHWNQNGLLSVAVADGSTTIMDLAYLKTGNAVNEMSYNWQRQGMTTFTEIKRRQHEMHAVRWNTPFKPSKTEDGTELSKSKAMEKGNLIALGGSDGIIEMLDLTERRNIHA